MAGRILSVLLFVTLSVILTPSFTIALPAEPSLGKPIALSIPTNISSQVSLLNPFPSNVALSAPALQANFSPDSLVATEGLTTSQPTCNASLGTNLNVESCYKAMSGMSYARSLMSLGQRGHGYDIQVPCRISSRQCLSILIDLIGRLN